LEKLGDNLREVRPTLFVGVPRVWEKIQAKITEAAAQSSPAKKLIGRWARKQGLAGGQAEQNGRVKPLGYCLANALVFNRVRTTLGLDNCRMVATTAAPISMDTLEFFQSLGLNLLELYGMSECSGPSTMSVVGQWRLGWAGRPLAGTEVKLAERDELCLRGRHVFKGYFKDEKATAEAIDSDGWLHSGDVAEISEDGFVRITDRLKEIIITAGGKNIAPQQIEAKLKAIPGVDQVVVIGERRKYLTALFTLDEIQIPLALERAGSPATDVQSATQCKVFRAYVSKHVDAVNQALSRVESIKRFTLLPQSFSIETGELTHTMKLKRRVIRERFKKQIDSMYPD